MARFPGYMRLMALFLCAAPAVAPAAIINGPSSLLTQGYADQLETWLGEGSIEVTRIFQKQSGDDSLDFHAAADGQGRTFVLIEVLERERVGAYTFNSGDLNTVSDIIGTETYYDDQGQPHSATLYYGPMTVGSQIIGGYNPQSWDVHGHYHFTATDSDRTAFLFNLTSTEIQQQNLSGQGQPSTGPLQTFNSASNGPTFGGGHDIWVTSSLSSGYAYNYSYGGTTLYDNIIAGGQFYNESLAYGRMEVFTIANLENSPVPEPSTLLIVGGGLGLALVLRRRARKCPSNKRTCTGALAGVTSSTCATA